MRVIVGIDGRPLSVRAEKCGLRICLVLLVLFLQPARAQQSGGSGQGTGQNQGTVSGSGQRAGPPAQGGVNPEGRSSGEAAPGGAPAPSNPGQVGGAPATRASQGRTLTGGQSFPGAAVVSGGPVDLGLGQAIELAIKNNLSTLLARERRREAGGREQQARAGLLPDISATSFQADITQNLAALGFQPGIFPGLNTTFIGPFRNFDARARLVQSIFSLSAIRTLQAGRAGVRVAELEERLAREQVAAATALTYLEALRANRAVAAAQANVELAQTLAQLARDQRAAGVATGVDVTRAETRLAQEQVRLAQATTDSEQAVLNVQRIVGLQLGGQLTLTDPLRFTPEALPTAESALAVAAQNRPEVSIAEAQLSLSDYERRAVRAELYPSVDFAADYGVSGITPTNTALPTRRVAVQLNVPIFNGGLTRGRLTVATSQQRQAELQLSNTRGQVEEDVRLALVTLRTIAGQVRAADQSVALAEMELTMSRDRFRAGVANNLEVVNAQTSLANARDAQVEALARYSAARLNLASALGRAEQFRP